MERVVPAILGEQRDRLVTGYRWAAARPSWITRLGLLAALLLAVPLLLLAGIAVVAGLIVLVGLSLVGLAVNRLRALVGRRDGRANVRVIRRPEDRPRAQG